MRKIHKVRKIKEKQTFMLDSMDDFKTLNLRDMIPAQASNIEFEYKDKTKILVVDYLISIETSRD